MYTRKYRSLPAWAAWIEIWVLVPRLDLLFVAARMGSVD